MLYVMSALNSDGVPSGSYVAVKSSSLSMQNGARLAPSTSRPGRNESYSGTALQMPGSPSVMSTVPW